MSVFSFAISLSRLTSLRPRRYFLLTPKLLPDLQYHPLMKVLVIQAGTWLPDKLSLADVVKRKLKRKAAAIATA